MGAGPMGHIKSPWGLAHGPRAHGPLVHGPSAHEPMGPGSMGPGPKAGPQPGPNMGSLPREPLTKIGIQKKRGLVSDEVVTKLGSWIGFPTKL